MGRVWGLGFRVLGFGFWDLPIVSIVVPFFWLNQFYVKDPKR